MGEISSIAQRLLQFSPDAMLVVDAQGIIRFSNETSSTLFGYSPDQLIGQPIKLLIPERFHTRHGAHVSGYVRQPTVNGGLGSAICLRAEPTALNFRRAYGSRRSATTAKVSWRLRSAT